MKSSSFKRKNSFTPMMRGVSYLSILGGHRTARHMVLRKSNAQSLQSDWITVGCDLQEAIAAYEKAIVAYKKPVSLSNKTISPSKKSISSNKR